MKNTDKNKKIISKISVCIIACGIATNSNILVKKVYADNINYDTSILNKLDDSLSIIETKKNKLQFKAILTEEERIRLENEERIRQEEERIRLENEKKDYQNSILNPLGGGTNVVLDDRVLDAIIFARNQIGKPYIWGGVGSRGYDCSGLTMKAYESVGISIGRTTFSQIYNGIPVNKNDLRAGDLVLFNTSEGYNTHVGLYIGYGMMIHAPQTGKKITVASVNYSRICGIRRIIY